MNPKLPNQAIVSPVTELASKENTMNSPKAKYNSIIKSNLDLGYLGITLESNHENTAVLQDASTSPKIQNS